jgi:uncharacterized protein (DUF849 family)/uncharacterized protein (DUF2267 family)
LGAAGAGDDPGVTALLEAALNGSRTAADHPAIPRTPAELAAAARGAVDAGARALHLHAYDDGAETLAAAPCAEALRAVRAACPGVPLSLSTSADIEPDPDRRLALVAAWTELPDLVTANQGEAGIVALCEHLLARGVGIEAGLLTRGDAEAFVATTLPGRCTRAMVEPLGADPEAAVAEAAAIEDVLARAEVGLEQVHHGDDLASWAVSARAVPRGHGIRTGLEDTTVLPDGRPAADNAELVRRAAALLATGAARPARTGVDDARRHERFLTTIREETGLDRDRAERAAMATLVTLGERLGEERAQELAEDLPGRLATWLADAPELAERFHVEAFVRRVAEREEGDLETASRHARAVLRAFARVAPAHEVDDLVDALPREFEPLLGDVARELRTTAEPEVRTFEAFLQRVRARADLDLLEAQRASEVVLEVLAEQLADGEVRDLQAALPGPFGEALERGRRRRRARPGPRSRSLDETVAEIAQRREVDVDTAFRHLRAVVSTLAEALPPPELHDVLGQLPPAFRDTVL